MKPETLSDSAERLAREHASDRSDPFLLFAVVVLLGTFAAVLSCIAAGVTP